MSDIMLAWTGTDKRLNVMTSPDGHTWSAKHTNGETSDVAPAVAQIGDTYFLAWTGTDRRLNVMHSTDKGATWQGKVTLPETSNFGPALSRVGRNLVLGWTGTDTPNHHLNTLVSTDQGKTWNSPKYTSKDYSNVALALSSN